MPPTPTPAPSSESERLAELLNRPREQRIREYKYRFGQSIVFGLPVIALHYWGRALGPADFERWGSLLMALLCGWVVYVNLGMTAEAIVARRLTWDFAVGASAGCAFVVAAVSAGHGMVTSRLLYPLCFHAVIMALAAWSLCRWIVMSRSRATAPRSTA